MKKIFFSICIIVACSYLAFGMGRKPSVIDEEGVNTDGIIMHLAIEKPVHAKYDILFFAVTIKNSKKKDLVSKPVFSEYVEPSSAISLIAVDEEGTRYSGFVGNRTDPGEDFDHYAITILPEKVMIFDIYHRELRKPIFQGDRPFAEISDRPGTYTIHAQIKQDLFNTKYPLVSNKITINITKK